MRTYRVAIVEPAEVVGVGVAELLGRSAEVEVKGVYSTLSEVVPLLRANALDALFVSVSLGAQFDLYDELKCVVLIGIQCALESREQLRRFASVVTLYSTAEEMLRSIGDALNREEETNYADSHELSERERDVLVLVARGYTNKEIATELNISPHTVISHRKNIVHKTGIRSVAGLTVYAVLNKLITNEIP